MGVSTWISDAYGVSLTPEVVAGSNPVTSVKGVYVSIGRAASGINALVLER